MKRNMYRFLIFIFCGALFFQMLSISVHAEPTSGDQWEFQLASYAWLAGQNGKVATLPGLPPADVDIDFYDDILGNINLAGMLVGEARKGRYGLFMDIVYTDIEMNDPTPLGIFYSSMISRTKSWIWSVAGLYRLVENQHQFRCHRRVSVLVR